MSNALLGSDCAQFGFMLLGDDTPCGGGPIDYTIVPSGGVVCGGSATVEYVAPVITITPSGGVVVGGSADVTNATILAVSGGVVVGGSAEINFNVTPAVRGGGVVGGGAAWSVEFAEEECCQSSNTIVPSGGVVIGGSAIITTNIHEVSGGVVVGGSAIIDFPTHTYQDFEAVYHLLEQGDGSDDEYVDSSGHGYHAQGGRGFATRTPVPTGGVFFQANEFDGNDFINTPEFRLADTSPLTVSLWAKRTNEFLRRVFYSIGATDGLTPEGWQLVIGHDSRNRPYARVQVVSGEEWAQYEVLGASVLSADCWYHVAAVWQPGVGLSLYINGELDGFEAITETTLVPATSGSYIGRRDNIEYAQAKMQEVRISPLVRGDDWLAADYAAVCDDDFYVIGSEENVTYEVT